MQEEKLTFNDFLASKHQYDHSKEYVWDALGANEKDVEELRNKMKEIFENKNGSLKSLSERIEKSLELDVPAPWKALGFLRIGRGEVAGKMLHLIENAPDEIPLPLLKHLLCTALITITMGD